MGQLIPIAKDGEYATEATYRDDLAGIARRHQWQVATESPMHIGKTMWGRADIIINWKSRHSRGGYLPVLVECKRKIAGAGSMRRAIEQVVSYRKILGLEMDAVVTAPTIECDRPNGAVLRLFNVLVLDKNELCDVLRNPPDGDGGAYRRDSVFWRHKRLFELDPLEATEEQKLRWKTRLNERDAEIDAEVQERLVQVLRDQEFGAGWEGWGDRVKDYYAGKADW